jgi:hypothetical protein
VGEEREYRRVEEKRGEVRKQIDIPLQRGSTSKQRLPEP